MTKRILKAASCMLLLILVFSSAAKNAYASEVNTSYTDKPRVVLDGFEVSDDVVVPGEDFELTFTLRNSSIYHKVDSILLTYTNDLVVPIYGQDDQIYIDTIPAGGTKEVSVTLSTAEKVNLESIKFEIHVTFSDDENSNNNNIITIQLPITKTSKFDVQNITIPDSVLIGNKTRINVTYKNTGVDDFYNITMNINGKGLNKNQQINLGSLVAGKVNYTEFYVDFEQIGEQKAEISFNYEDIEGNNYKTDIYDAFFTVLDIGDQENIETMAAGVPGVVMGVDIPKIVLLISICVMAIIVFIMLRKRSK